jgi:hypothetical protein
VPDERQCGRPQEVRNDAAFGAILRRVRGEVGVRWVQVDPGATAGELRRGADVVDVAVGQDDRGDVSGIFPGRADGVSQSVGVCGQPGVDERQSFRARTLTWQRAS